MLARQLAVRVSHRFAVWFRFPFCGLLTHVAFQGWPPLPLTLRDFLYFALISERHFSHSACAGQVQVARPLRISPSRLSPYNAGPSLYVQILQGVSFCVHSALAKFTGAPHEIPSNGQIASNQGQE